MCTKVSKFIKEINKPCSTPYTTRYVCTADDAFNWAAGIYEGPKNRNGI